MHPAIRAHILEGAVEDAIVAAFLFGPAEMFLEQDRGDLGEPHLNLCEIRNGRDRLVTAINKGSLKPHAADSQLASLDSQEVALESAIAETQARYASASFADIRGDLLSRGRTKLDSVVEFRATLRENYRGLSLDQKRRIIEALLAVEVTTGYALKRVFIRHKVVTSLNAEVAA